LHKILGMYRYFVRPFLFLFNPETAHNIIFFTFKVFRNIPGFQAILRALYQVKHKKLERTVWGINFPSPVGLAAGLDKKAAAYDIFQSLGFGFVEVGTVTPKPQPGNPKPRLFRLVGDQAIINRMGFNNIGIDGVVDNLKVKNRKGVIIGGNIGKNTATSNDDAANDYLQCLTQMYDFVDYFVVNVSCPNIANLSKLQSSDSLGEIVDRLVEFRKGQATYRPILLKISPDLSFEQIDDALNIINQFSLDGIVAVNTTTGRDGLSERQDKLDTIGNGGLSGKPLTARSLEVVRYISMKTNGQMPIVGVGGIMTVEDALSLLRAGAYLIQVYSGFIYSGPKLVRDIHKAIIKEF
jgi:dihydroorotate dehydrogenase